MKKKPEVLMKHTCVLTLFAAAATANPLVYPTDHKWNFSVGVENGIEQFDQNNPSPEGSGFFGYSGYVNFPTLSTGYKIASTQTAGYGKWFYLQSRLSYTIGYTTSSSFLYITVPTKSDSFFDGDWSVIFPIQIPSHQRITLGPQLGLAYMQHKVTYDLSDVEYKAKSTYVAALFGVVFGLQPTDAFALRTGLNFQIPKAKSQGSVMGQSIEHEFRQRRHSINAFINLMYQLSKHLQVAGTLEHKSYSVIGGHIVDDGGEFPLVSQMLRTSATCGVKWVF